MWKSAGFRAVCVAIALAAAAGAVVGLVRMDRRMAALERAVAGRDRVAGRQSSVHGPQSSVPSPQSSVPDRGPSTDDRRPRTDDREPTTDDRPSTLTPPLDVPDTATAAKAPDVSQGEDASGVGEGWSWGGYVTELGLDEDQARELKPVFEAAAARWKDLASQGLGAGDRTKADAALRRELYEALRPRLRPTQWFPAKVLAGWSFGVEFGILRRWDWRSIADGADLDESLRAYFDEPLRRLHEAVEKGADAAELRRIEREARRALLEDLAGRLPPERLAAVRAQFGPLDN